MMKLTVNKSKFYALAKEYWPDIEPMRRTEFVKFFRVRDYKLTFRAGSYYHDVFLSACFGRGLLADEYSYYEDNGEEIKARETHRLDLDTLRRFGMLEEIPDANA